MKRPLFAELVVLSFAITTATHAQLMRVTFDSTDILGDFYEINVNSPDRNEFGNPIHHVHSITGSLHFETYFDLAAAAVPAIEPQWFGWRLWGDIDVLGHVDIGDALVKKVWEGVSVTRLPNGMWNIAKNSGFLGPLLFNMGLTLNPDLSPAGAGIELRIYGDPEGIFTGGPGLYAIDSSVWASASGDEMTATIVQGPPFTPVPEPATASSIAALGLCGLIGWRRWLRCRADTKRAAVHQR